MEDYELILEIAAAALLNVGSKSEYTHHMTNDIRAMLSFCFGMGASVGMIRKKISICARKYAENRYSYVSECSEKMVNTIAGIAAISSGTTCFNCKMTSLAVLGENTVKLIKELGCIIRETDRGFIIASAYNDERIRVPSGVSPAFICGLCIGSAMYGMDQQIYYTPGDFDENWAQIIAAVLFKFGIIIRYTNEGAYISASKQGRLHKLNTL